MQCFYLVQLLFAARFDVVVRCVQLRLIVCRCESWNTKLIWTILFDRDFLSQYYELYGVRVSRNVHITWSILMYDLLSDFILVFHFDFTTFLYRHSVSWWIQTMPADNQEDLAYTVHFDSWNLPATYNDMYIYLSNHCTVFSSWSWKSWSIKFSKTQEVVQQQSTCLF